MGKNYQGKNINWKKIYIYIENIKSENNPVVKTMNFGEKINIEES